MNPHNFVPSRLPRPMKYTDGSDSREVEEHDDWDVSDDEDLKKFKEGFAYKKPVSVMDIRDKLVNIIELIDVSRVALLAANEREIVKVANVLFFHVITPLEQLEKEIEQL
jgi:hypothetical protein